MIINKSKFRSLILRYNNIDNDGLKSLLIAEDDPTKMAWLCETIDLQANSNNNGRNHFNNKKKYIYIYSTIKNQQSKICKKRSTIKEQRLLPKPFVTIKEFEYWIWEETTSQIKGLGYWNKRICPKSSKHLFLYLHQEEFVIVSYCSL